MGTNAKYNIVDDTYYDAATPASVINILERSRKEREDYRIVVFYGNHITGMTWGDIEECFIGRSTGSVKIPLVIYNRRSMGGAAILDSCIVKILLARGKRVLYQHPKYHTGNVEFYGKNAKYA